MKAEIFKNKLIQLLIKVGLFILHQFDVPVFFNNSVFLKPLNVFKPQETGHSNSSTQRIDGNRAQIFQYFSRLFQ